MDRKLFIAPALQFVTTRAIATKLSPLRQQPFQLRAGNIKALGRQMPSRSSPITYRSPRPSSLPLAFALAACIFPIDTLSSLHFAVASLYVLVILISARDLRRRGIILTTIVCATPIIVSYLLTHGFSLDDAAPLRSAVSFVSIAITLVLVLQSLSASERLAAVQRERTNLARFFSPTTVEQLVEIDVPLSLARRQRAAVLFADIVGFTMLPESLLSN
jgi:hypothetical protein